MGLSISYGLSYYSNHVSGLPIVTLSLVSIKWPMRSASASCSQDAEKIYGDLILKAFLARGYLFLPGYTALLLHEFDN